MRPWQAPVAMVVLITLIKSAVAKDVEFCAANTPDSGCLDDAVVSTTTDESRANESRTAEAWEKITYRRSSFTNDLDWPIREELDEADELIADEPEEAIRLHQRILEAHPDSLRARYSMARAMQILNVTSMTDEQPEAHQRQVLDEFLRIVEGDESVVPMPLYASAFQQSLYQAGRLNDTALKIDILRRASAERYKKNDRVHILLANELILAEEYKDALAVLDDALESFHWSKHLTLLKGVVLKKLERKKEANHLLRSIEAEPSDTYYFGSDILQLCDELRNRSRQADVQLVLKEASKIHLFLSQHQRPLDADPDLEAKPWWHLEDDVGLTTHHEEVTAITEQFEDIVAEALELRQNDSLWMPSNAPYTLSGRWLEFPLFAWGSRRKFHCSLAPRTCRLLQGFKAATKCKKCVAKFNVLTPGTKVGPHTGPTNARLRLHLCLRAPADGRSQLRVGPTQPVPWEVGKWLAFDDSFEHLFSNEDPQDERIVLSIDVPHPDVKEQTSKFTDVGRQIFLLY